VAAFQVVFCRLSKVGALLAVCVSFACASRGSNTCIQDCYACPRLGEPVLRYLDRCFLSYEMGLLKPDSAFFHYILRSLQIGPTDCVFIDDRPENVDSARALGITALRLLRV